MPVQAPESGADEAIVVRNSEPTTASVTNPVPPRRYRPEIACGSPIRRRSHEDRSSDACSRIRKNNAASVKITR